MKEIEEFSPIKKRAFKILSQIDDFLTLAGYYAWKPLMSYAGIEAKLTKSPEERIEYLTEILKEINENGGIKDIRAAFGGDDGDMDELAEALVRAGIIPPPGMDISHIKITETPIGPAPEEVRRSWVGMEMVALKVPASQEEEYLTTDPANPPRDAYVVLTEPAIAALKEKSPDAALWFQQNFQDFPVLAFGANEVEIIASTAQSRD